MIGSSPLLINEHPLQVLPSLAKLIGLNEAIALQQVHYWMQLNAKDPTKAKTHFRDGRWWTYNSYQEWKEHNFPFWSVPTIRRAFNGLEKRELLLVAQYNAFKGDCTNWYSVDHAAVNALLIPSDQSDQRHLKALPEPSDQDDQTPVYPCDQSDHSQGSKRSDPVINSITSNTETIPETNTETNTPLTPHGGNGEGTGIKVDSPEAAAAAIADLEQSLSVNGGQAEDPGQVPSDENGAAASQDKKTKSKSKKKGRLARMSEATAQAYEQLLEPERFEKFWDLYGALAKDSDKPVRGDKPEAARVWTEIVEADYDLDEVARGFSLFAAKVRANGGVGFVQAQFFLGGKQGHTQPYWQECLELAGLDSSAVVDEFESEAVAISSPEEQRRRIGKLFGEINLQAYTQIPVDVLGRRIEYFGQIEAAEYSTVIDWMESQKQPAQAA